MSRFRVGGVELKSLTDVVADHNTPVSQILTAVRVVAARAGVPDLADWASREAGGYANDDELPAHRTWRLTVTASLPDCCINRGTLL